MSWLVWLVVVCLCCESYQLSCDKTRHILSESWGVISHGPPGSNYTQDSHCEWLIKANSSQQFISLRFLSMGTECSYDYVYVFNGDSFGSVLLGSFSGKTEPQEVVATSGFMLILLYSDTNYVLEGFRAEYSVTNCPGNCSGHGICLSHSCFCERNWGGHDCSVRLCPYDCGGSLSIGVCVEDKCVCKQGYSGQSCSLDRNDTIGNKWHWLSSRGLKPRASHSAVYIKETDSLYVFGGYDLNHILGDLAIFKFNSSQWEDHMGNVLSHWSGSDWSGEFDAKLLKEAIDGMGLGLGPQSFLKTTLHTITNNRSLVINKFVNSEPKINRKNDDGISIHNRASSRSPSPRYAHAASEYPGGFVLFGGRLIGGRLSNELWLYGVAGGEWTLRGASSVLQPPPLASHTLTLADNGWLYVLGGTLQDQKFSSKIYRIKLSIVGGEEVWEEVIPRGGKESDIRLVGHTTAYLSQSSSLLVYAGIAASVARFSKLSDRMFSFTLESRLWAEIHYPRSHSPSIPSHRAFHSASIIGNYLVIFGGYTHKHNKEEICYDNQIYLYHLGCHTWVNHDILGPQSLGWRYPKTQGVFSHGSGVRNGNTLLIVAGYHGNVNSDLLAFLLPPTLASREGERYEPELICNRHSSLSECTSDPECGWCSADDSCQGRTVGVNCTTNLQTTRCPGVCPALSSCHACLARSPAATVHPATASVAAKLRLSQCTWCVQNARCHHKHDNYGVCGVKEDTPSQAAGWWGDKGLEVSDASACSQLDRRPGLTFILYKHPVDYSQPDAVSVVNASSIELRLGPQALRIPGGDGTQMQGSQVVRLRGFLRPADSWSSEHLRLCVSHAQAVLKLAPPDLHNLEVVANVSSDGGQCRVGVWPGGGWTTLPSGRHLIDLEATTNFHTRRPIPPAQQSKIELQHNKSLENPKVFTFEYLEPYEGTDSCSLYSNCLACLTDSKCGWCQLKETCYNRNIDEANICQSEDYWQYLVVEPSICVNCSNHASCEDCLDSRNCEWSPNDARCLRKGRSMNAVTDMDSCPSACHKRSNCSECLDGNGRCVWCQSTQECFSFSMYTSQYQYGICREWLDGGTGRIGGVSSSVCPSCRSHSNCSSCLQTLGCGWCYDTDKPIVGICVQGDFTRPQDNKCSYEVSGISNSSLSADEAAWSYAQCPDVDECGLGIHDCHPQAKCTNTHGSFTCQCKRGYIGDGRHSCTKTCYNKCVHGYCVGSPHYTCQCDLGWTGPDCSISCGCNNHSTCSQGVNICDHCNDWTTGEFCQFCKAGSYGNATSLEGCRKCNCNDHGNTNLDVCNSRTGLCFCKDNTEGASCDKCKKGFYGDPRRGGTCYYECRARGMLNLSESQGLGSRLAESSISTPLSHPTNDCLWILSANSNDDGSQSPTNLIELTIDLDIKVPCTENSVYVYDGMPHFVSSGITGSGSHQSQVLGVFCTQDTTYPVTVQAKSGYMTVHYKQGRGEEGFNATVSVLSCPDRCPKERLCIQNKCVCPPGSVGPNCQQILCPNNCSAHLKQGVCDKAYGRCLCTKGWGGWDCSQELKMSNLVFTELFNSAHLSDGLDHLRKMLPRFGHSLLTDRRGSLWLFGGYSLSHGPLNDIRLFDIKNNTWMQVTVDSTNDANMPRGRYFHAAEISQSRREIYIHGGLTNDKGNSTLGDFWKFNLKAQRWIEMEGSEGSPGVVAGHTLTLRKLDDQESLILIGGFSPARGFLSSVWEFNLTNDKWKQLTTSGNPPAGVYGHSTVYHSATMSFYVFGGVVYSVNTTSVSNKLFAFHYPSLTWTSLPVFSHYNPPKLNLPGGRLLHSAVTTDDYMLVFGGRVEPPGSNDTLIAYSYACNLWLSLLSKDVKVVGMAPPVTYAHAMTLDSETSSGKQITAYIMGGFTGSTTSHVTKLTLPADLCALSTTKEKCRSFLGCSYCSVTDPRGNSSYCYSNVAWRPVDVCHNLNGTQHTSNGVRCSAKWLSARSCDQFNSCTECLARWPYSWNQTQVCKWCSNCGVGKCIQSAEDCSKEAKCGQMAREITSVSFCPELQCSASDCTHCLENNHCAWTRQVLKTPEEGMTISAEPVYAWNCVSETINERSSFKLKTTKICSLSCSLHTSCESCLESQGGEGGWAECKWSTLLSECISPAHQPLYCSGGVCGRVLSKQDSCPQPCQTYTQCSTCLSHAHCGWCSTPFINTTGQGLCWEGSVLGPTDGKTCPQLILASDANLAGINRDQAISWHYLACPPEDECSNGHHNCDPVSETCVDTITSYTCDCAKGYRLASTPSDSTPRCVPVCPQGCVRGTCTAPGNCSCDFGYVGANCSIQCQCNGHSNCAGPDKLDSCLDCKNNTQGEQCSRCKPLFVGDPSDNGQCVPCVDYCNGHTWLCINDSLSEFPFNQESPRGDIERFLTEGPTTRAKCIGCSNKTKGDKCEDCLEGHFRGSEDQRAGCRPCQCHGHGDTCDPVSGERCNCGNNTESEPGCKAVGGQQCWALQCSRCKESYMGTPTSGHQCYKQMSVDLRFCFDSKLIDECKLKPRPLNPKHTVFFAVQPRFMNVDIRITIDVTQGNVDLYMSPRDDTFVVEMNSSAGSHFVELDSRYQWRSELKHDGVSVGIVKLETGSNSSSNGWHTTHFFFVEERYAKGLSTFVKIDRRNTILMVRNLTDRLVITLPQDKHDLGSTRFYIAMAASSRPAYGTVFFRQDQLHIDLFVFFSVFFSCFFLFLAALVVAWKAKQAGEERRARRRHVEEMLHMAQRPFATVTVVLEGPSRSRSSSRKSPPRPIAVEPTRDNHAAVTTVFVRLPGGSEPLGKLAIASSLVLLNRSHPLSSRPFLRRRSNHS